MKYLFLLAILSLASCTTPEQRAAQQKMIEDADHAECIRLGFDANSEKYGECRLKLREIRAMERAADRAPYYHPHVGIGWGVYR